MDVKLGETRFFDFVTVDPATGFPTAIFSAVFDVHLGGSNGPEAYHPNIVTREGVGHYSTNVQITTANGFAVGTNYAVSVTVTFTDGGQEYEIPLGNFMVRRYSVDDIGAKTVLIGTAGATVENEDLDAGEMELVIGDTYSQALGNEKQFSSPPGFPDPAGLTPTFGVGPLDDGSSFTEDGRIVSWDSGTGVIVAAFPFSATNTGSLSPTVTAGAYGGSWHVPYPAGERTGGRVEVRALRKWDD
jgi:hypothetical protein